MAWSISSPRAFRLNNDLPAWSSDIPQISILKSHDSHPSFDHLVMLVFQAVMEVVCVSLPGYIIARAGQFDADKQKWLANLNIMLFTPCLIFTKLASQLSANKLVDLAVIPVIFVIQTLVSYVVSIAVSKLFRLGRRPQNFVTAMGVFGNSNSLPISLVISLSSTLKGLHWDKIPGDNDGEVAARGILYLLIFQQLGQLVRWSWGYHVLLAPKTRYDEYQDQRVEEARLPQDELARQNLIAGLDGHASSDGRLTPDQHYTHASDSEEDESDVYEPAGRTPVAGTSNASPAESDDEGASPKKRAHHRKFSPSGSSNRSATQAAPLAPTMDGSEGIMYFPRVREADEAEAPPATGVKGIPARTRLAAAKATQWTGRKAQGLLRAAFARLPRPVQTGLTKVAAGVRRTAAGVWEFMNPPLWAMLIAIVVASVPDLQRVFFTKGTFVNGSVTKAITQSGGVAVPVILVVLGANLARNTQSNERADPEEKQIGTRLLVASLVSRMILPTLIMAPVLALFAKYVPVSILADPIFIVVCFLLTGAPSALQLAQICQINEVYEGVMSKLLFQSYVIWILPSTLVLVMLALETLEWTKQ